jgi:hypothetical protein
MILLALLVKDVNQDSLEMQQQSGREENPRIVNLVNVILLELI